MAKEVVFKLGAQECKAGITKVDRDKVYGWTESKYTDAGGELCRWATLLDDGRTIIATGGSALKKINTQGYEIDKSILMAIDADGNPAMLLPSVFDGPVELDNTKTLEDYLSMDVKAVYQLAFTDGLGTLLDELKKYQVLYFPFNYRADYEPDDAFVLAQDQHIFIVTGAIRAFEYSSLNAPVPEVADTTDDSDELDFTML